MPTVTLCFESTDQRGSRFSMLVLAVMPFTRKPVTPCSEGGALVAKVEYTLGQFGALTVLRWPETPFSMTFCRFGISPRTTSGRMTSSSAPFKPITMARGRELLLFAGASCANANVEASASKQSTANENRRERRFTAGSSQWVVAGRRDKFNPKLLRDALARATRHLFVAQSLDGIELRGAARRVVAEEHADAGGEKAPDHEDRGREL